MGPHITAFDVETTGRVCTTHQIAQIAMIRVTADLTTELCRYASKVRIENIQTAEPGALAVWGYDEKEWAEAPPLEYVMRFFAELACGSIPLGYNVQFDLRFVNSAFAKYGIARPWVGEWAIDPMQYGKQIKVEEGLANYRLGTVAEHLLGRVQGGLHDALEDTILALDIERCRRGVPIGGV